MVVRLVLALLLAVVVAAPAQARDRVTRAQLDGDPALEQLRTQVRDCGQPYRCSRLAIRDGRRQVSLTPLTQRPRFPYGWTVARKRLLDFTGDGISEIAFELRTAGSTVSSPWKYGVSRWDGRRAHRIFEMRNDRDPEPGYASVIYVVTTIVTDTGGLPEIETRESLHRETDGNCCPSAFRITRHRWDGTSIAPVPGSVRIEET